VYRWTRRVSVDGYASACCALDLWPLDLITVSQAQVYTWPNCGEITSNSYKDIVFTQFFESLPAVTLTFENLLILISISMNPVTSVAKIGWNSFYWFLRYYVHNFSGRIDSRSHSRTRSLTHGRAGPNTICFQHRFPAVAEAQNI